MTLIKISLQPLFTLNPERTFIIIFMQGFTETWKLFQGFLQVEGLRKAGIENIASNGGMIQWWWVGKDLEGNDRGLIETLAQPFPRGVEENLKKNSSQYNRCLDQDSILAPQV
jgi:hypothetical protein